jgi:DNA-binding beta-propeller fold protein YncE
VVNTNVNTVSTFTRNTLSGALTLINTSTVGIFAKGARGICISADGKNVYITHTVANIIAIYDRNLTTGILTGKGTIGAGLVPYDICISADGTSVYAINNATSMVSIYTRDTGTGALSGSTMINTSGANPEQIVISMDGTSVYMVHLNSNTVSMFSRNITTGALSLLGTIGTQNKPNDICISADGRNVYVTNEFSNTISMYARSITGVLSALGEVASDAYPLKIAVSADGLNVYVTSFFTGNITVFDRNTTSGMLSFNSKPVGDQEMYSIVVYPTFFTPANFVPAAPTPSPITVPTPTPTPTSTATCFTKWNDGRLIGVIGGPGYNLVVYPFNIQTQLNTPSRPYRYYNALPVNKGGPTIYVTAFPTYLPRQDIYREFFATNADDIILTNLPFLVGDVISFYGDQSPAIGWTNTFYYIRKIEGGVHTITCTANQALSGQQLSFMSGNTTQVNDFSNIMSANDKNVLEISKDGNSLAIGSIYSNNGTGAIELYTKNTSNDIVYKVSESAFSYVFKGADFLTSNVDKSLSIYPFFGFSLSILGTLGNRWLAVGAPKAYDGKGLVWIWRIDERDQASPDTFILKGENNIEQLGTAVKLFIDPSTSNMTLAVGTSIGIVKIFTKTGSSTTPFEPSCIIVSPNRENLCFGRKIEITEDGLSNIIISADLVLHEGVVDETKVTYVYSSDGKTLLNTII